MSKACYSVALSIGISLIYHKARRTAPRDGFGMKHRAERANRKVAIANPTYSKCADRIADVFGVVSILGQKLRGGGCIFYALRKEAFSDKLNLNNIEESPIEGPTAFKSLAPRRVHSRYLGEKNKRTKKAGWEAPLGGVISKTMCTEGISALSAIHRLPRKGKDCQA